MGRKNNTKRGKRQPNGQLRRDNYALEPRVLPSEWVQAQRARYGEHYNSALGRAYASGLLGEGNLAKSRLDAGKRFVKVYQRFFGGCAYTCPLDDTPRGGSVVVFDVPDHQDRDRKWIGAVIDSMDVAGVRPYVDQLLSSQFVDTGPAWLDNLLNSGSDARDQMILNAAIRGLDIVAPEARTPGILVSITA